MELTWYAKTQTLHGVLNYRIIWKRLSYLLERIFLFTVTLWVQLFSWTRFPNNRLRFNRLAFTFNLTGTSRCRPTDVHRRNITANLLRLSKLYSALRNLQSGMDAYLLLCEGESEGHYPLLHIFLPFWSAGTTWRFVYSRIKLAVRCCQTLRDLTSKVHNWGYRLSVSIWVRVFNSPCERESGENLQDLSAEVPLGLRVLVGRVERVAKHVIYLVTMHDTHPLAP